ncbi:MAG: RIP metalloprotease RseP [Candidatus Moranbacteria bacterium]|nr:RIP metalloprotease RseP [Candidatus Moranbacteria bacterium]
MSILIFIVILLVVVVVHEFGHFIVAKKFGIRVDEFSFGFPPKIIGKKIGETTYNLNALPFGGYVKIYGEDGDEETLKKDGKRSFISKPRYVQALVLVAGVFMNFVLAWVLLSAGFMTGLPSSTSSFTDTSKIQDQALTITSVTAGSPAEQAGLKVGDKIEFLDTDKDSTLAYSSVFGAETVQKFVKSHQDEKIRIHIVRANNPMAIETTPTKDEEGVIKIGITMDTIGKLKLPIHQALYEGAKLSGNVFVGTAVGFYDLIRDSIKGKGSMASITGPVGIVGIVGDAASFGFVYLLSFTALISINLAVINLIPFPALDGGRLLFLLIEKIKGSRIKSNIAGWVNSIGFGILIILMLFVTYHDIVKIL